MKRIFSLALAGVMVFSALPMAYAADVDYQNGTEVEYTGSRTTVNADGTETHNAEYTITVPALLAPGGSGTVTLQGMWPSDATVKVTAEDKVEMVNNINSADKKELAVTFTAIELAGNNTVAVSDDETVSVADISNALFGTWSGKFNYNVEYNGEAGGSGTVTPTPDPEQPGDGGSTVEPGENQISFTINGVTYLADEEMTWGEWVESDYNTVGFTADTYFIKLGEFALYVGSNPGHNPKPETPIESGTAYNIDPNAFADEPEANLITFTIDGTEYQAEEGWTWGKWYAAEYKNINISVNGSDNMFLNGKYIRNDNGNVYYNDVIDPNINYTTN